MKRHLNLMTETAQFRVAARISLRHWALVLAAAATLCAPLSIWHWQERRRVRQEHAALEATYQPYRQLMLTNAKLRTTASALVNDERLLLELSRERPAATLLGIVSAAVEATGGDLFVERLDIAQTPPGGAATATNDRLIIDAICTPQFDVSTFTAALRRAPIGKVAITADDLTSENGVDAKHYTIECLLTGPKAPKAANAN